MTQEIKPTYVTFEQAEKLKEKRFDVKVNTFFDLLSGNQIDNAPLGNYKPIVDYSTDDETRKFKTYEEAELACLRKLIEIVKNK